MQRVFDIVFRYIVLIKDVGLDRVGQRFNGSDTVTAVIRSDEDSLEYAKRAKTKKAKPRKYNQTLKRIPLRSNFKFITHSSHRYDMFAVFLTQIMS